MLENRCIDFKPCLLAFKAVDSLVPSYLFDLCCFVSTVDSRQTLCAAAGGDLIADTFTSDFGQRSFLIAALKAWNELPNQLQNLQTVNSLLKTFLFNQQPTD